MDNLHKAAEKSRAKKQAKFIEGNNLMQQERNLQGFGRMVLDHLKNYRPNQYAYLKRIGEVKKYCLEMEDQAEAYLEQAQMQRVDPMAALEIAKDQWLLLDDWTDETGDALIPEGPLPNIG